jgi:hypothetical protein
MPKLFTKRMEDAAQELARGIHSDERIAEKVGVARKSLYLWKQKLEFAQRVEEIKAKLAHAALKEGLALESVRVNVLKDLHSKMLTIAEERGQEYLDEEKAGKKKIAGAKTGLVTKTLKGIGSGPSAFVVEEYTADVGLVKTIQGVQEQIAKELGQSIEKHAVAIKYEDMSDAELASLAKRLGIGEEKKEGEQG